MGSFKAWELVILLLPQEASTSPSLLMQDCPPGQCPGAQTLPCDCLLVPGVALGIVTHSSLPKRQTWLRGHTPGAPPQHGPRQQAPSLLRSSKGEDRQNTPSLNTSADKCTGVNEVLWEQRKPSTLAKVGGGGAIWEGLLREGSSGMSMEGG